jgi:hypothetical protein
MQRILFTDAPLGNSSLNVINVTNSIDAILHTIATIIGLTVGIILVVIVIKNFIDQTRN